MVNFCLSEKPVIKCLKEVSCQEGFLKMEHDLKMWAVRCLQAIPTVFLSEYRHEFYSCSLKITGTTGPVDQFVVHIVNNFRNEGVHALVLLSLLLSLTLHLSLSTTTH